MIVKMTGAQPPFGIANRAEVELAGEGGQGMILAGIILAEAATIYGAATPSSPRAMDPKHGSAGESEGSSSGRARLTTPRSCSPMWSWH